MVFARVEEYLQESLAATLETYQHPLNPALSAVKVWMLESGNLVKMTDKNLGVTVVSKSWYREQMGKLLNTSTYEVVVDDSYDSLLVIARKMQTIERLAKNKFLRRFLALQPAPRIPKIHGIPKAHKSPWTLRPIVPCHSSCITGAAKVLEAHIALYLPSYDWIINSTKVFIRKMEQVRLLSRYANVWLVSADV